MDQGLAAFFASVAALVGALIGGGFSARAARIGGEKTVQAAREQVRDQARAESERWLMQARHDAYQLILGTIHAYEGALVLPTAEAAAMEAAKQRFHSAELRVKVVGPEAVRNAAHELSVTFINVQRVLDEGQPIESWMASLIEERHSAFVKAVTAVYAWEPDTAGDVP
ncbi:hypothetical protein [Streptomyces rapamycinicus]|uniref:Uncharacterized protein n=2 Tax=Streptomyces rapamycinicus TaxID=1226757 RepID=A0A0A0NVT3_STRRN|nr:hypothetical protein [Streptomyces rapamycinicus]AGP60923.1 hypothetical protein M271_47805 [Streptomyces rapamycinicus NRRL 5491]MBB4787901.1 glutathione S-transferase [Streptomyces rapamycinicus]RLV72240.1 hypothetical protein D3C57_146975 [Streptomyces rapamycinicus NRRL 5491]UTP36458.1 hypothetical protein LIV37_48565 [Streptomyces rapamycinicus NRRL 5491]